MKKKIKKFLNSKIFVFIITAIIFSTIGVSADALFPSDDVIYDNSVSGLSSNNVQEAIDELYNACLVGSKKTGEQILDKEEIVTSGVGLYKDEYVSGRYLYKGKSTNNYITFNGEKAGWKILSIEPDNTIKIIKLDNIGKKAWDSNNNNIWESASLNTYLNGTYLKSLSEEAQNQIVYGVFSAGEIKYNNDDLSAQIDDENSIKWTGKIALPTASEYIRSNSDKNKCGTFSKISDNYNSCKDTSWMYNLNGSWLLLSSDKDDGSIFNVYDTGDWSYQNPNRDYFGVRPVLYLSSNLTVSGIGTKEDPYTLSK